MQQSLGGIGQKCQNGNHDCTVKLQFRHTVCHSTARREGLNSQSLTKPSLHKSPCFQHRERATVGRNQALPQVWQHITEKTLARDSAAVVVSAIGGFLLIRLFDALQQAGILKQKTTRKCVHIFAGPGLLLCWPFFRLLLIGTGVVKDEGTVMAVSREGNRHELLRGPLYYVLVLIAVTLLFWRQSPIGITVIALMCGGDGLADLVGRKYGKIKLPYNQSKSWAGSLAMFLGGFGLAVALISLFDRIGLFECTVSAIAGSVAIISASATLLESLPINSWLDDNLSVPVLAAVLGQYLFASSVVFLA